MGAGDVCGVGRGAGAEIWLLGAKTWPAGHRDTVVDPFGAFELSQHALHRGVRFGGGGGLVKIPRSAVAAAVGGALLVCWSRICIGAHFPSDVLVGALVGVLCATAVVHGCAAVGRYWAVRAPVI